MEIPVETDTPPPGAAPALEIRLLGPVRVLRDGAPVPLPKSRKLRALLALLATEGRPVGRSRLCDLLWDLPSDPRAELRWHLSKLRQVVDGPGQVRVISDEDAIGLDLAGCRVDALELLAAAAGEALPPARLAALAEASRGVFLGEMELSGAGAAVWLAAQRRRFGAAALAVARALVEATPPAAPGFEAALDRWLELAPFEIAAHARLLAHLCARGRLAEAETHLAATERLFRDEGLPLDPLRAAARAARGAPAAEGTSRARAAADIATGGTPPAAPPGPVAAPTALAPLVAASPVDPPDGRSAPAPSDPAPSDPEAPGPLSAPARRSALAVMPFTAPHGDPIDAGLAEGLTHDVITRLAKLRSLSIIARGSVHALDALDLPPAEAGRRLGVDYIATGSLRRAAGQLRVELELSDTATGRIVWTELCEAPAGALIEALDELGDRITAALAGEVELAERNRAILRPPASLDAWGAHHRGLWHMYRFTKADNAHAQRYFERAVALDPTFSRALAGLSFTHWQSAFQHWADPGTEREKAYAAAAQSLLADEQDPAAHWAMGRALWLGKRHDAAVAALRDALTLSPNFALGHYSLAFVESQTGDPMAAIHASDRSRALSPFDPLMFGMMGSRAIAHLRLGQTEEAADWAARAAARPNAHVNILGLAALCLSEAGRIDEGRALAAAIHAAQKGYGIEDFLAAFHFPPERARQLRAAAARVSLA